MKLPIILFISFSFVFLSCCNCSDEQQSEFSNSEIPDEIVFDSVKAADLGADIYGMKKYVIAFLKRGANNSLDSAKSAELQRAHLDNIDRMAREGKLVLAGPFMGKGDLRGIYIFNVESVEEAENLTKTDPAIQQGVLSMELKEWYGSAALMEVNNIHKTIAKEPV